MINAAPLFNLYGLRSEEPTKVYLPSAPPSSGQQHRNKQTYIAGLGQQSLGDY